MHDSPSTVAASAFDLGNVGVALISAGRVWLRINPCLCKMLGYSEAQLQNHCWQELIHPEDLCHEARMFKCMLSGEIRQYELEVRFLRQDGRTLYTSLSATACSHDSLVDQIMISVIDITESKETYSALARLNTEIEQRVAERTTELGESNRILAGAVEAAEAASLAKSTFLASMSHELRTPLNTVIGFSRLLTNASGLSADESNYVRIIRRSAEDIRSLIDDMLELSKIEAGRIRLNMAEIDLSNLLGDIFEMLEESAEKAGLQFRVQLQPGLPGWILGDGTKLKRILLNLLGNAIKFTQAGSVSLNVSSRPHDAGKRWIDFAISDTDPGIDIADHQRIFEPSVQLTPPTNSSRVGLGLSICRKYLHLMGSDLVLKSSPGQGSIFRFSLLLESRSPETDQPSKHHGLLELNENDRGRKVLVAEDNSDARLLIASLLDTLGFAVTEAKDGFEALRIMGEINPELIMLDWRMPNLDGLQTLCRIRALSDIVQPKIFMLTANAFEEDRQMALRAGADAFLCKPLECEDLYDELERHLGIHFGEASPLQSSPRPDLSDLPPLVRENLCMAVKELNQAKVLEALAQLPEKNADASRYLHHLATEFRFKQLWQLLQESPPTRPH